ncbi:MAG: tetratricopeptide repeat protein [Geminocystis sp.]|nr:tetratricopeptide repeat protein [Geminocystis sp.]HIK36548.1 tetratricopeptide repeat protein [Geminocystis sp. M7585_C2015_104]MCS7148192.1 tetratricopeptide repeat protein [Geminocystis sp.]MCX8077605.1 tetratricopeptide repeat protein [Geminocystis sp.]MDW8117271.1 tetratricopeptide repeat protein [Geminocystis sp.]
MFEEIAAAIEAGDYQKAKSLMAQIALSADNPWCGYYRALIVEKEGDLELAESQYRQIIKDNVFCEPKLLKNIRDALERILQAKRAREEEKKQEFQAIENSEELAVLILEPVAPEERQNIAQALAKIMKLDTYTARLQIPTRSWRLFKTGSFGDLSYYQFRLRQKGIPCFCHPVSLVNKLPIYQVAYIEESTENCLLTTVIKEGEEAEEKLNFLWDKINNIVLGLLPIFELTTHVDAKGQIQRKISTLDYVNLCDLHLIQENVILRLSDNSYEFSRGIQLTEAGKTNQEKWRNLMKYIKEKTPSAKIWNDFTPFGEGAVNFSEMLKQITSHINIFRREESVWDEAFQLYSGLIFLQTSSAKRDNI